MMTPRREDNIDPVTVGITPGADPSGLVADDVPCRGCSYNVKGLSLGGKCPECGTPVGISIHGDLLRYSDPKWVEKLALGMRLILWGMLITIAALIIAIPLAFMVNPKLGEIVGFLGGLVVLAGAWLLTEPDPGTHEPSQTVTARRIVRIALLLEVAHNLLSIGLDDDVQPKLRRLLGLAMILLAIAGVIGVFAQLYYLEMLARRIPDEALAKRANQVRWGFGISYGFIMVFASVSELIAVTGGGAGGGPGTLFTMFLCFGGFAGIAALVYAIIYLVLLFRFNRALKAQSHWARETWAAATTPPPSINPPPVGG
jgi:hypothetical protein